MISHPGTDHLKQILQKEWVILSETRIIQSCDTFRRHVQSLIDNNGWHIELNLCYIPQ